MLRTTSSVKRSTAFSWSVKAGASMVASRRAAIFSSATPTSRAMRSCWKTS